MKVIWTRKADNSFNGIVDYLLDIWNIEIATSFVDTVNHTAKNGHSIPLKTDLFEPLKKSIQTMLLRGLQ